MSKLNEVDELFRCLFAGITAPAKKRQAAPEQAQQLLLAFNKIEDPKLRQELVLLIEIVSQMPEMLQRGPARSGARMLSRVH